jgi:two-component system repressor protein LuxO
MASVLIVEDHLETLHLFYKAMMKKEQHTVSMAISLKEAACLLDQSGFELILLDLEMPEGSGLDLYRAYADVIRARKTLVVAVSAEANHRQACREAGIHHFFLKPIMPSSLANIVSKLVEATP